jgi:protein-tyrosine phosphatase
MIDLHCHILPGLDDGPASMDKSIAMARASADDGISTVVATVHVGTRSFDAPAAEIRDAAGRMRERLQAEGIPLKLLVGTELAATSDVAALVEAGRAITLGEHSRFLLIELPFTGQVTGIERQFFDLEIAGYKIVLAHPERSMACQRDPDLLTRLHERGYRAQVNAGSLAGREGRRVRNLCIRWLREGLVDAIASDGHDIRRRPPIVTPARRTVLRVQDETVWQQLTVYGPATMLNSTRDR